MKAIWHGVILAESDATRFVDGSHYFPPHAVRREYLVGSDHRTHCSWKGEAHYFHLRVKGELNPNAAWSYREPLPAVRDIGEYIAFWQGVDIVG